MQLSVNNGGQKRASYYFRRRNSSFFKLSIEEEEENRKVGVCFSGGGIRSAAFCAGVLRELLKEEVEIDYMSTVSGGGYVASSYLDWKYRKQGKDDPAWHKEYFERMLLEPSCGLFRFAKSFWLGVWDVIFRTFGVLWNVIFMTLVISIPMRFNQFVLMKLVLGQWFHLHFEHRPPEETGSMLPVAVLLYGLAGIFVEVLRMTSHWRPTLGSHLVKTCLRLAVMPFFYLALVSEKKLKLLVKCVFSVTGFQRD